LYFAHLQSMPITHPPTPECLQPYVLKSGRLSSRSRVDARRICLAARFAATELLQPIACCIEAAPLIIERYPPASARLPDKTPAQ